MANENSPSAYNFIRLATKPSAQLSYSFAPATAPPKSLPGLALVVFVNGLGRPQTSWTSAIEKLSQLRPEGLPAILTFDRFGQGQSVDRDPDDEGAPDPLHAHDCMSAVRDMRQLLCQITRQFMGVEDLKTVRLVFVGNSIGCALIRLYAQEYLEETAGILFLDSTLTNSDFVSIVPDPADPQYVPTPGITADELVSARKALKMLFHPDVGSKEGLSRRNLQQLLPHADSPKLAGVDGNGPFITVAGHDFDTFAEDTEQKIGISRRISEVYFNPFWHKYNEGLAQLSTVERSKGPFQALKSSHFIQEDNPDFVAEKLGELIDASVYAA